MRLSERQIIEQDELIDVLLRANTIRLGIHNDPFPYVVPLSFGFEECNGQVAIFTHGAEDGLKHTLLDKNNHVCVEADIFHRYVQTAVGITTEYESVIGFGTAEAVHGAEVIKGLDLICAHSGYQGYVYDATALPKMRVYKILLSSITGKRRFVTSY